MNNVQVVYIHLSTVFKLLAELKAPMIHCLFILLCAQSYLYNTLPCKIRYEASLHALDALCIAVFIKVSINCQ